MKTHDAYVALRYRDCRLLMAGSLLAALGRNMVAVAVGWELYERTHSAMALAWVGLVQALPVIALSMPAGHVADRRERRGIVVITQVLMIATSLGLAAISRAQAPVSWIYLLLLLSSVAQSFKGAAAAALLPQTVPEEHFSNAITWKSSTFQIASVAGPALGGLLIAVWRGAAGVYALDAVLGAVNAICPARLTRRPPQPSSEEISWRSLAAGFRFVWRTQAILGTLSLDLFATLLGGATMLLPIYASDILHVGPAGLGWLRAAPAVGAFAMAFALAHLPPMRRSGLAMLWGVAGFGVATVIFGVSRSFPLSLAMLALTGALDNISVVVRHSLVQLLTPDALRGRVSAVNNVFIICSNEVGAFESGAVAAAFGAVASAVIGGVGSIVVVLLTVRLWPEITRLGTLHDLKPAE